MLYAEKIQYFVELIRHGSFSNAAKHLDVVTSTVTKAVTSLEKELGKTLVKRLKSGVKLTPVGQDFFESVIDSYLNIEHKFNYIKDHELKHKKSLKIITTTGMTSLWLMPRLEKFREKYPKVSIHIQTTEDRVSLSKMDADVAILPAIDDPGAVIKKRLVSFVFKLYASQKYIDIYGEPKKVSDLKNHNLIGFYHAKDTIRGNVDWHLNAGGEIIKPSMVINSISCVHYAALLGYGIITLPKNFPFFDSKLINILPSHHTNEIDVFFITRKNNFNDQLTTDLYDSIISSVV